MHFLLKHGSLAVDKKAHERVMEKRMQSLSVEQHNDWKECQRLQLVWWYKFDRIREYPNERQCVKFDRISDILKRFFMEQSNERDINSGRRKWAISFEEILTVYPNKGTP